jgi:hypothetical protein
MAEPRLPRLMTFLEWWIPLDYRRNQPIPEHFRNSPEWLDPGSPDTMPTDSGALVVGWLIDEPALMSVLLSLYPSDVA